MLALTGIAVLIVLVVLLSQQRALLYFPDGRSVGSAASRFVGGEDVALRTADGLLLGAWFVPARSAQRITVLVMNGNGGNRSDRAPLVDALSAEGFAVLLLDYRGYGGNPGTPSEEGLLRDARSARAYLESRADVDPRRVVYLGESLGAAVAVALAAERPPPALVLRSPFSSLAEVGRHHYPYLPVHPLLLMDPFPSNERIGSVACPVLVVAGAVDRVVPPEHSRRLFDLAAEPKRFVLVPDADHNDAALLGRPFVDEVARFIRASVPPGG
ncbi:MAG: alpha/beta hydrolase [Chloroflexi bacterium]|nr:alpha/beta hydrolase [Chloroflexota bacterium]